MLASVARFAVVLLVSASCFVRLSGAVPLFVSGARRDVVDPPVTAPNTSTVWVVGETQTVVWNTSNLPSQITNTQGTVLLGFVNDSTGNEHLMIDNPLASGFDIRSGSVNVVVPDVEPRSDYIVALLGDSGNISDMFTVRNSTRSVTSASHSATNSASTIESSLSSGPTETQISKTVSPTPTTLTTLATHTVSSSVITPTSSGTLKGLSSQSSSGSAVASQSSPSPSSSDSAAQLLLERIALLIVPAICMILVI